MSTIALDQTRSLESLRGRQSQERLFTVALLVGDVLALTLALGLAYFIRFYTDIAFFEDVEPFLAPDWQIVAPIIIFWIVVLAAFRLYDLQNLLGGTKEYASIFNACAVATCLFVLLTFFVPVVRISRGAITLAWIFAVIFLGVERFFLRRAAYFLRGHGWFKSKTLIVGVDGEARAIAQQLQSAPTIGAQIVGFVAEGPLSETRIDSPLSVVGTIETLPELVERYDVNELIVSTAGLHRGELLNIFQTFANSDRVEVRFSSGLYELFTTGMSVREVGQVPLVSMNKLRLDPIESAIKTVIDKTVSFALLVLLSPLYLLLAILIKLDSPGPVIHRRRVLGHRGQPFDALKFRTMYTNSAEILQQYPEKAHELELNHKVKDDPRITRIGAWLRRCSLDELPQLVNILWGQMSLVGPRMISPEETPKYGKWKFNLLTVKPGLTGLWQVKGRSNLSYDERVRLDMYYIRNYTIWLDLQILAQTVPVVLSGTGAY